MSAPLIIAAHGSRDPQGVAVCRELVERVAALLPDVAVSVGFVELAEPDIATAVAGALGAASSPGGCVVVPLMIGTGAHVTRDIPEAVAEGVSRAGRGMAELTAHLGTPVGMRKAMRARISAAMGEWAPDETTVVFLGRGTLHPQANAAHCALARLHREEGGYRDVLPAYIQVTEPDLSTALDQAAQLGADKIVIAPHFLFPGRLRTWTHEQASAWASGNPGLEVRVAEIIGPAPELAELVVQRYREGEVRLMARGGGEPDVEGAPVYLAGLAVAGREVLVVGGGAVATRRVPKLLDAGARVRIVSPALTAELSAMAQRAQISHEERGYLPGDVAGAWYVLALSDDPLVNEAVVAEAEACHTWCVRADDAIKGSAWTPATGRVDGLLVGVIGDRNPRRSASVRDEVLSALADQGPSADEG